MKSGEDAYLGSINSSLICCADESCHTSKDLPGLVGKYDMVNFKLDKTGGVTEMAKGYHLARELGFKVMVGCMVGPEQAIKPALSFVHCVDLVDLDGPMFLA